MGMWVSLENKNGDAVYVDSFEDGGTYLLGGSEEATLSVTSNYSKFFNFRELHEKTAMDTIVILHNAVEKLGTTRTNDYWESTEGNAGYTCNLLLNWAKQYPNCAWRVN